MCRVYRHKTTHRRKDASSWSTQDNTPQRRCIELIDKKTHRRKDVSSWSTQGCHCQHICQVWHCLEYKQTVPLLTKIYLYDCPRVVLINTLLVSVRYCKSSKDHPTGYSNILAMDRWAAQKSNILMNYGPTWCAKCNLFLNIAYLLNKSMLRNTYSPLSKFNSWAFIRISLTESAEAHNTTTEIIKNICYVRVIMKNTARLK